MIDISDGLTGLIVSRSEPNLIADAIDKMANDTNELIRKKENISNFSEVAYIQEKKSSRSIFQFLIP